MGSVLFVMLAAMISGDSSPSRIAAHVVSGIAFLGAGVIIRDGVNVRGLITAATFASAHAGRSRQRRRSGNAHGPGACRAAQPRPARPRGDANAIKGLGEVARLEDRYEEAAGRYERALALYRQIGDRLGEANTLLTQGRLARAMGELDRARAAYREAERIYRAIGRDRDAEQAAAEAKELPA
jgi:tetratricopeptide (TPR) repeat protein